MSPKLSNASRIFYVNADEIGATMGTFDGFRHLNEGPGLPRFNSVLISEILKVLFRKLWHQSAGKILAAAVLAIPSVSRP